MSIENKTEFILEMRGLCVDGYSNEGWMPILKGSTSPCVAAKF